MFFKQYTSIPILIGLSLSPNSMQTNPQKLAHFPINNSNSARERVSFNEKISHQLRSLNRFQQAYYLERSRFAISQDELRESGLVTNSDLYDIVVGNKDNVVSTFALPKQDYGIYKIWSGLSWIDAQKPLYSYVGTVTFLKEYNRFQAILCVSQFAGKEKLNNPKISDGKFVCALGTEEIP